MPGPGAHMAYALGSGVAFMHLSDGRFSPQHCLFYALNAFLGPDLGPFAQWLTAEALGLGRPLGDIAMEFVHDPLWYAVLLGLPLSLFYSWLSLVLLRRGVLDAGGSGASLSRKQCFMLVAAGSLTHFFLDHLFEENGHSSMFLWILSTGWWKTRAPINADAVFVIGLLCTILIGGFVYINRVKPGKPTSVKSRQSMTLILVVMFFYCLWCASQIYWRDPPQPAIGEEADLGVLVFLCFYFFTPHCLCILSMNQRALSNTLNELPL